MLRKSLIAMMVVIMGITGNMLSGVAIGADQSSIGKTSSSTSGTRQGELVLDSKDNKDYVMVDEIRFEITSNTVIKNREGVDVKFDELPIPCQAIVEYYKGSGQNYIAVSIQEVREPV